MKRARYVISKGIRLPSFRWSCDFGGRVIDTAGDGILAEFPSVVNAVKCAVAIQSKMAERNVGAEPERCMEFRIGVNIGDVVYDEARIYGDGINVAARLEAIAEPGGICISSKVYEEVSGRIDLAYQDIGEQQLKNIARPVRVYRVQLSKTRIGAERRLTAILAADIAGYSRLVENDDEGTLARWKAHWHALIEPNIKEFHGRIVRVIGDGVLVEFASVVDAVRCAIEVQRGMAARNADVPHDRRIELRMGINFGELILDGGDFCGDAVNIAARLEALAEPGGICVSGRVQEDARGKLDIVFEDAGEQQLKNIARPVRVYRIRTDSGVPAPPVIQRKPRAGRSRLRWGLVAVALLVLLGGGVSVWQLVSHPFSLSQLIREVQAPALLSPDKRSIAVLPFVNMSSDPEQEYFSDGMTEDLITELSRLSGLFVIARNSVFTFKGRAVKPEQVSRELGVRYLIEGSVRKADNRVRITAQLIDANTGYHMWAQYYDRDLQDVFAVQEEIARRITSAMAVKLTKEEEKHMGRPYTSSEVAWEYFMRGAELVGASHPRIMRMRGSFSRKLLTWTRSLQGRMRVWLPPIGEISMGGGLRTPNLQRTWPIAWRKRRLSWREGSSNLSLRCHMLSNKWAGFSCTERNIKRPGRRQRRRSNSITTTRMAMPYGRMC